MRYPNSTTPVNACYSMAQAQTREAPSPAHILSHDLTSYGDNPAIEEKDRKRKQGEARSILGLFIFYLWSERAQSLAPSSNPAGPRCQLQIPVSAPFPHERSLAY